MISLTGLVLFCEDIESCRDIYEKIGFCFTVKKRGAAPSYYISRTTSGFILELRPARIPNAREQIRFMADDLGAIMFALQQICEIEIISGNIDSPEMITFRDPDGRRIILSQSKGDFYV